MVACRTERGTRYYVLERAALLVALLNFYVAAYDVTCGSHEIFGYLTSWMIPALV
jgi:hypothetical protein